MKESTRCEFGIPGTKFEDTKETLKEAAKYRLGQMRL